jgi:hypothetical protein
MQRRCRHKFKIELLIDAEKDRGNSNKFRQFSKELISWKTSHFPGMELPIWAENEPALLIGFNDARDLQVAPQGSNLELTRSMP